MIAMAVEWSELTIEREWKEQFGWLLLTPRTVELVAW